MTGRRRTNVATSVRDRLLTHSRATGEDFLFLLQRFGAERFLFRLGESPHSERFVLKGAMLYALWGGQVYRPTRDLDFTGYGAAEAEQVLAAMREICMRSCVDDGLTFDTSTLRAEPIREGARYHGLRISVLARLGSTRIPMQVDMGFGDAIEPPPADAQYPTLLDAPPPRIRAYRQEAVVAEKFNAMVVLGESNSRFKDFYDLYALARQFEFDGTRLARAIRATFERRGTPIDVVMPLALMPRFFAEAARAAQWRAYLARSRLTAVPAEFDTVGVLLLAFLVPVWKAIVGDRTPAGVWPAGGPWSAAVPEEGEPN